MRCPSLSNHTADMMSNILQMKKRIFFLKKDISYEINISVMRKKNVITRYRKIKSFYLLLNSTVLDF